MKNYEKLKQEHVELKERLHRLIDFMNSEEYFAIPESEKSLLNTQRTGMELYLNALTARIYGSKGIGITPSSILPLMMGSLFSSSSYGSLPAEPIKKETSEQQEAPTSEHVVYVPDNK